jgi:pimeloyl-ACP methyl ester carboxylesterase
MRNTGRSLARSIIVAILTALAALIIGVMQSLTTAVTASIGLSAFKAIIVPGTGTPHPQEIPNYLENALNYYVVPGGEAPGVDCPLSGGTGPCPTTTYGVNYYAQFWPVPLPGWGGLEGQKWNVSVADGVTHLGEDYSDAIKGMGRDDRIVIFGYSQGATVANKFKAAHPQDSLDPTRTEPLTDYFFIGDPQRPSGGFFERLAFLGNVPILDAQFGEPSPTDTCDGGYRVCATDFALQYDGVADFPQWLANPVAVLNAVAGFQYIHGTYLAPDDGETDTTPYGYTPEEVQKYIADAQTEHGCDAGNANYCQRVAGNDTRYITLPARYLPLYQPFIDLGDATGTSALIVPIVDLVSPATQTIIETGYDRTDYSKAQPGTLLPPKTFNPIQTAADLVHDVPEGINMALTPGRTPLPGSPPPTSASTLSETNGNQLVASTTTSKPSDGTPLIRLGLIAKPGEGVTTARANGSNANRPLSNALKDFHPVRDVVKAVSGEVKKALGKDDNSAAGGDTD